MKALVSMTLMVLVGAYGLIASTCYAFFPEPGEVAVSVSKEMNPLSSFQAILSFPEYPEVTCNLWVKGDAWRQEFVETIQGKPMLVRVAIGSRTSLARVFPHQDRVALPGLVVWQLPFKNWLDMGMNPSIMSYQFLIDRPCLVVGAEDGQILATQFWMDNERHIPVRVIRQQGDRGCDLIWDAWSRIGNFWLPHTLWRSVNGQDPLEVRIRWNGVNVALKDDLFSSSAMDRNFQGKSMYPSASPLFTILDGCPFTVQAAP